MAQEELAYNRIQQQIQEVLTQIINLKTGRPANVETVTSSVSSVSDSMNELEAAFRSVTTQPAVSREAEEAVAAAPAAAARSSSQQTPAAEAVLASTRGGRRITRKLRRI